jgi:hypothetical protein
MPLDIIKKRMGIGVIVGEHRCGSSGAADTGNHHGR